MSEFETKDSGERLVFESGMQRDVTTGKTQWHLVADGPLLHRYALLLTRGAEKYEPRNWMKASGVEELERFKESAFRHFMQWYYGDDDEDHAAAVVFNMNGAEYVANNLFWDELEDDDLAAEVDADLAAAEAEDDEWVRDLLEARWSVKAPDPERTCCGDPGDCASDCEPPK